VLVALIFTPALCATLLKPPRRGTTRNAASSAGSTATSIAAIGRTSAAWYARSTTPDAYLIVFVVIIGLMALLFTHIPKSFLPDEDQGILFAQVITPRARPRSAPRKRWRK